MKNLFTNLMKNTAKRAQNTGGGASRQITARFESAQMKNTSLISGCSAVDVPMTSYGASDEHPMSIRSASDGTRWNSRVWKYVAMIFAVLVMSIANVGIIWGADISNYAHGWEDNSTSQYTNSNATLSISSEARTGTKSMQTYYNGTGDRRIETKATFAIPNGSTMYAIGYAKLLSSDATTPSSSTQAYLDAYVGGGSTHNTINVSTTWQRMTSYKKAGSAQTGKTLRLQRKHAGKGNILFDDIVIYVSTDTKIDLKKPGSATSASATTSSISWTCGTDVGDTDNGATGIQATLIFHRTGGSVGGNDLTLNDQGIYSLTATEGPSVVGNWTLLSASVAADATSYSGTFTAGHEYAIVHRDLAYNYSTPTYVTVAGGGGGGATTYDVIVEYNGSGSYGTAAAADDELAEDATTTITATPESGYRVASWEVSGTGASLSDDGSTHSNTTTLTMGTADATVTCTFEETPSHGISAVTSTGDNTYGTVTAPSSALEGGEVVITAVPASGYRVASWAVSGTGASISPSGTSNSNTTTLTMGTADATVTVTFEELYTLTYNGNGGTGSMSNTVSRGTTTLRANTYTKDGYVFAGWATSQANADAGTIAYANKATTYSLTADATLYAVWYTVYYSFAPTGEVTGTSLAADDEVSSSSGGSMTFTPSKDDGATLKYTTSNGLEFGKKSSCKVTVALNSAAAVGDIIEAVVYVGDASTRGLMLQNSSGTTKADFSWATVGNHDSTYVVATSDGIASATTFLLARNNTAYLKSLKVAKWVAPACEAPTSPSISGTTSYTAGNDIELTASATGTDGSTTYQWYKGDPEDSGVSQGDASTNGATFSKASCEVADAGTYYCVISNGDDCNVTVNQAITVAKAAMPTTGLATGTATGITATGATLPFTMTSTSGVGSLTIKVYKSDNSLVVTEAGISRATSGSQTVAGLSASTTYYYTITPIGDDNHLDGSETGKSSTFTTLDQTWELSYALGDGTEGTQSGGSAAGSYSAGATITAPAKGTLEKDGYTFRGWSDGTTFYREGDEFVITSDVTLTAVWDAGESCTEYEVLLSDATQEASTAPKGQYVSGKGLIMRKEDGTDATVLTETATPCHSSTKYFTTGSSKVAFRTYNTINKLTIYAIPGGNRTLSSIKTGSATNSYGDDIKSTCTIKMNGSAWETTSTWTKDVCGELEIVFPNTLAANTFISVTLSGNVNVYGALFENCVATNFTVSFADGNTAPASHTTWPGDIEGIPSGSKILKPATDPTAAGYTFGGWYSDAACTAGNEIDDWSTLTITADKTIYAKWVALPASTTPTLPSLSNTEACAVGDFGTWNATPTNASTISAAGESVSYSWKNNSSVEVATTATYKPEAAGTYTVTVTVSKAGQADASETSDALTATLNTAASKTADPTTATITAIEGESFTISGLTASNATGYQWYSCNSTGGDKSELTGKTSATLTDTKEDAGTYYYICTIGNACGDDIDSRVVTVNVYDKCFEVTDARKDKDKDKDNWGDDKANGVQITDTHIKGSITGGTVYSTGSAALGANTADGLVMEANKQITVTLSSGSFQVGTLIQIVAHSSNKGNSGETDYNKYSGLKVGSHTLENQYKCTSNTPAAFTQTYMVVADDGIAGRNSITIEYAGDAKTYLYSMVVANCALCTPISPTLTYSTSTLYAEPVPTTATATLTGYYGTPTISYASSNTSVATVNETTGKVTAVAAGTATITATIGETTVSTTDYCGAVAEAEITVAGCGYQEIAKLVPTDASEGTLTNSVAATKVISGLQSQGSGWYKLGSKPSSFGITLTGGYQVGDSIIVRVKIGDLDPASGIGSQTSAPVRFFGDAGTTAIWTSASAIAVSKDTTIRFVVDATMAAAIATSKTIELYRTTNEASPRYSQNHQVYSMIVKRNMCSDGLAEYTGESGVNTNWNTAANWAGGKLPSSTDRVVISSNMTVDIPTAQAKEIILDQEAGGTLTIAANQALVVTGTIKKWDGSSLVATTAADLKVESSDAGNGTLIFENDGNAATVQMYSKAEAPKNNRTWKWQYAAAPAAVSAIYNYYGGYLYKWNDGWNSVSGSDNMELFAGYCVSYPTAGHTFEIEGELAATGSVDLTIPAGKEWVVGNSWTAPIQIKQMTEDDFENVVAEIHLFNTGMDNEDEGVVAGSTHEAAGSYRVVTPATAGTAGLPAVISSLQGFYVANSTGLAGTLKLDYAKHVRPSGGNTPVNGPMLAPRRVKTSTEAELLKIVATGSRYCSDVMLFAREDFSYGYDICWDGRNINEPGVGPLIYTLREDGTRDAISAIPEYEGAVVGFVAGEDSEYTFRFTYDGADIWYLNDTKLGQSTLISNENTYTFTVTGDDATRFVISKTSYNAPSVTTGVGNQVPSTKARKLMIDGILYIIREGRIYTAEGALVK